MAFATINDKRVFKTDDSVYFDIGDGISGSGKILGKAIDHIIQHYIVLLDIPITAPNGDLHRAILVQNTLMRHLTDEELYQVHYAISIGSKFVNFG
jgi:hypothetical protein